MVDVKYQKGILKINHIWFSEEPDFKNDKFIICHGISNKFPKKNYNMLAEKQYSLITDLSLDKENIYNSIRKNIRYEIRKCQKEGIVYRCFSGSRIKNEQRLLKLFKKTYEEMYQAKGMNIKFNSALIKEYIKHDKIVFTIAYYKEEPLVFHSYIVDEVNARFYYSASPFRSANKDSNLLASMNKGLHWFDIQTFKQFGMKRYDWGGIANPRKPNGIDTFKMGFGGKPISYFNIIYLKGLLATLYFFIKRKEDKYVSDTAG